MWVVTMRGVFRQVQRIGDRLQFGSRVEGSSAGIQIMLIINQNSLRVTEAVLGTFLHAIYLSHR